MVSKKKKAEIILKDDPSNLIAVTEEHIEFVLNLYAQGLSAREIRKQVKVHKFKGEKTYAGLSPQQIKDILSSV
jgi:hypothetical protein